MIGRTNARRGARRIFTVLQNRRLNHHIAYTIVDEVSFRRLYLNSSLIDVLLSQVFTALFPESNMNTETRLFSTYMTRILLYDIATNDLRR